ncbi:MAG: hypothetical protein HYX49_08875 [Chloroflexi bacterium]|nr:hypothetical protein [Chloroflexota bacterium]
MSDKGNILVKSNDEDSGVCLYAHWSGSELPADLQEALAKQWRWGDASYLTRIIFDVMTEGQHGGERSFGISSRVYEGEWRVLEVNCAKKIIIYMDKKWSFKQYIALSPIEIEAIWNIPQLTPRALDAANPLEEMLRGEVDSIFKSPRR